MPAASDPASDPAAGLPVTWRPFGARMMGVTLIIGLYGLCFFMWFELPQEVRDKAQPVELWTLAGIGLLILAVVWAVIRSKATARESGLTVVNGYRKRTYAWPQIVAVRFRVGQPWVTLDLSDGETTIVFAIQATDGSRAQAAAQRLRGLVESLGSVA